MSIRFFAFLAGFPFVHDSDQILKREQMINEARFHRGRYPESLVDSDEVVPERVERNHVAVIFELL